MGNTPVIRKYARKCLAGSSNVNIDSIHGTGGPCSLLENGECRATRKRICVLLSSFFHLSNLSLRVKGGGSCRSSLRCSSDISKAI